MDITRENFAEHYPTIKRLLNEAEFVSFDEEMTGIVDRAQRIRADDTPDSRYVKMIPVATRYSIIQFGLSIFCKDARVTGGFVAHTYNFYLVLQLTAVICL
jgi:hypothetical protein